MAPVSVFDSTFFFHLEEEAAINAYLAYIKAQPVAEALAHAAATAPAANNASSSTAEKATEYIPLKGLPATPSESVSTLPRHRDASATTALIARALHHQPTQYAPIAQKSQSSLFRSTSQSSFVTGTASPTALLTPSGTLPRHELQQQYRMPPLPRLETTDTETPVTFMPPALQPKPTVPSRSSSQSHLLQRNASLPQQTTLAPDVADTTPFDVIALSQESIQESPAGGNVMRRPPPPRPPHAVAPIPTTMTWA